MNDNDFTTPAGVRRGASTGVRLPFAPGRDATRAGMSGMHDHDRPFGPEAMR